jgi:glycosyltransferase involved in cell wall biosynthesis
VSVRLSVVVPAYNEEARVGDLVASLQAALAPLGASQELVVVDDGSTDRTADRVAATGAVLLRHPHNRGKAAAVQTGIAASTGATVAVLDADFEYFPEDLLPMLEVAEAADGPVAVYGSRYLAPANFAPGAAGRLRVLRGQELTSWAANWTLTGLVLLLYRRTLTDTLTGLKLYPGDFLRQARLTSVGFEGDHEITAKLVEAGIPIVEIPIAYAPRGRDEGKKIGARDGVKAVTTLVRQRFARAPQPPPARSRPD